MCSDERTVNLGTIDTGTIEEKKSEITVEEIREKGIKFNPESAAVKLATYLPDEKLLLVDYQGGSSYLYSEVEQSVWDGLMGAPSTGGYIHRCIKGQHGYRRL